MKYVIRHKLSTISKWFGETVVGPWYVTHDKRYRRVFYSIAEAKECREKHYLRGHKIVRLTTFKERALRALVEAHRTNRGLEVGLSRAIEIVEAVK